MEADFDRLNSKLQNAVVVDLAAARAARDKARNDTSVAYSDPLHVSLAVVALIIAVFLYFFARR